MSASEFIGWQAYFSIYPFTQDREDERKAEIMAVIINANRALMASFAGKKTIQSIQPSKFIPEYIEPQKKPITDPLQRAEYKAFKQKLQDAKGHSGLRETNPPA